MQLSKNKKHQTLFFFILIIYTIFNGGNSNLLIQTNFILTSFFFLFCLKDKNYNLHHINFFKNNQKSLLIYLVFIFYLFFQIIPLPNEIIKLFSPEKFKIISILDKGNLYSPISFSPSNSFFQILNYITLLIIVFIMNMIFYTDRHKNRFYFFLSILGFLASITAIFFYLNGNPDILIFKNSNYKDSSTGFFVNRTVFAIFLLFSLISSLEVLRNLTFSKSKKKDNFFLKFYVRLFVIFITIGIITSFSRIGNFLLLITILFYLMNEFFFNKSKINSLRNIILLILIFDILILGIYFGSSQIIDRFYFLKDEFAEIAKTNDSLKRFQIIKFALNQLYDHILFGYGAGGFQNLFQINFANLNNFYADHAHSDVIEFLGEFGLIGFVLIIISFIKLFFNKHFYNHINLILICFLFVILLFDFSLHIPIIQIMFICFFILNKKFN